MKKTAPSAAVLMVYFLDSQIISIFEWRRPPSAPRQDPFLHAETVKFSSSTILMLQIYAIKNQLDEFMPRLLVGIIQWIQFTWSHNKHRLAAAYASDVDGAQSS